MLIQADDLTFALYRLHDGMYHLGEDGHLAAVDVHLSRVVGDDGTVLVVTTPEHRAEIHPWTGPVSDGP